VQPVYFSHASRLARALIACCDVLSERSENSLAA
jgi:hypothetical protein